MEFPLPNPQDPFSLQPGCISASSNLKASSEVDRPSSLSLAISGARAAATQFSKRGQNPQNTALNNTYDKVNNSYEGAETVKSYNLRSSGRSVEKDKTLSTNLNETFDDGASASHHEDKSSYNMYDRRQPIQHPTKVCNLLSLVIVSFVLFSENFCLINEGTEQRSLASKNEEKSSDDKYEGSGTHRRSSGAVVSQNIQPSSKVHTHLCTTDVVILYILGHSL